MYDIVEPLFVPALPCIAGFESGMERRLRGLLPSGLGQAQALRSSWVSLYGVVPFEDGPRGDCAWKSEEFQLISSLGQPAARECCFLSPPGWELSPRAGWRAQSDTSVDALPASGPRQGACLSRPSLLGDSARAVHAGSRRHGLDHRRR
jgi:hypothetical protein